jgi:hypothetical protein
VPEGWPHLESSGEVLAPFLECTSPAEFIALQRGVDMVEVVGRLDEWSAVRLGAQGPLVSGAEELNRKRAAFLASAVQRYGPARAQVFALYIVHTAFTDDLNQVLVELAHEKRLEATLGPMVAVQQVLKQRGLNYAGYVDRPEQAKDVWRGLAAAADDALSTSEVSRGLRGAEYYARQGQMPEPYQRALEEVEREERRAAVEEPGHMVLSAFDALTFGVPVGFYSLVAGTCHGVYTLREGKYEESTRELAAAVVLVSLYAGGKGLRYVSEGRGGGWARVGGMKVPTLGFEGLAGVAERLWERLGGEGMRKLAHYIQANREAALLVYEGGEVGAYALYQAEGNVGRAQAWLAEARARGGGGGRPKAKGGRELGGVATLVDEGMELTLEVVESKLRLAEVESTGARLPAEVEALERLRPSLKAAPAGVPEGTALWGEYVEYWEGRFRELEQGKKVKPPLRWEAYEQMRGLFARGLAYEGFVVSVLRADAALPRAQRRFLQGFNKPRIETNVGVAKPGTTEVRYADVLVIEEAPLSNQPPRVETFSFKSRNLQSLESNALEVQIRADSRYALESYGKVLDIRRPSLGLRGKPVQVQRVHLIYDGSLKPRNQSVLEAVLDRVKEDVKGVEVWFE